jgi:hypothetical protein
MSVDIATLSIAVDSSNINNATGAMDKATSAAGALEAMVGKVAAAFGLYKIADWVKDTALLSARYETLGVSMNVVGKNAGYTATSMAWYQKALQETGISALESRDTLTMMAAAQIDLSKSSQLARIAQDAAVIGNINSSEAFQRMIQGIRSGQTEILRTVGINVTFETGYKKLADQLGKTTGSLSELEKMQARTNMVMEYGKNIAGTYEAAMGTAGKQLKSMERYAQDLQLQIGEVFQPALNVIVEDLGKGLKNSSEWMVKNKEATSGLGTAMAEVMRQADGFLGFLGKMAGGGDGATNSVSLLTRGTQLLSLALADVNDALAGIWGTANLALASLLKVADEVSKKLVGGGGLGHGDTADSWKAYAMKFLNPLGDGTGAFAQWQQRTFGAPERTYADWTKAGMSDSEGGEGGDPYGVIKAQQKAQALEAAKKATEEYNKVLIPLNQGLAMEKVMLEGGERAAMAYKLNMAGIKEADAAALLVKWDYNKALKDQAEKEAWIDRLNHDIRAGDKQRNQNAFAGNQQDLQQEAADWSAMIQAAYPWMSEAQGIAQQQVMLNTLFERGGISLDGYTKRYRDLDVQMLKLRADAGSTWAIIGYTVTQNAGMASDKMVTWANNLDGVGRSWKTLGDTVKSVLRDMILQMQKAIIQQQLMDPFMKWAGLAIGGLGTGAASSGGYTGGFSSGGLDYPALGSAANAGSSVQSSIVVNVNSSTGETSSSTKATGATDLSRQIEDAVNAVIIKNQRQGGLLARTA